MVEIQNKGRRTFLRSAVGTLGSLGAMHGANAQKGGHAVAPKNTAGDEPEPSAAPAACGATRDFGAAYTGEHLNHIAFPMGGLGAGMICLEGTGALSHFSIRNRPDVFNAPCVFAAVSIKGREDGARVLEGPVPGWKIFGARNAATGDAGSSYGLPRYATARFTTRFPFATVALSDP